MAGKKASKKVAAAQKDAADSVTVPRDNVGAAVQAMIAEGATSVSAEEQTSDTWVVTRLA
jgi:hypothetical protein